MKKIWVFALVALMWGCKTSRSATDSGVDAYASYREDLSGALPTYPDMTSASESTESSSGVISGQAVDAQLREAQSRLYEKNKAEPYFGGYTVLVYSGVDRNLAFKTQDELNAYYPELRAEMQYQQPRYLVKVGKFAYKIEAQRAFSLVKGQFPSARIIPDRLQSKELVSAVSPSILDQYAQSEN